MNGVFLLEISTKSWLVGALDENAMEIISKSKEKFSNEPKNHL